MNEDKLIEKSYRLIKKDLGLEEEMDFQATDSAFDRLKKYLVIHISQMLDSDFNGLLNALYRIDIPEHKVKLLISSSEPDTMAHDIAVAIIEREKQKVITRLTYEP